MDEQLKGIQRYIEGFDAWTTRRRIQKLEDRS